MDFENKINGYISESGSKDKLSILKKVEQKLNQILKDLIRIDDDELAAKGDDFLDLLNDRIEGGY